MEQGYNAWTWLPKTTADIQTSTYCFKTAMENGDDRFVLSNTYRTDRYQKHFYEIWIKHEQLQKAANPACADLQAQVQAQRDALADTCNLYRRVTDDYVHYEVKP